MKDASTTRIVGYSMDERMTAALAVNALANAVALRRPDNTMVHSDMAGQFRSHVFAHTLRNHGLRGSMVASARPPTTPRWSSFSLL